MSRSTQGLLATPPVNTSGKPPPTRPSMFTVRLTMALCRPRAMASGCSPRAMSEVASVSANTVHMELISGGFSPRRA